MTVKSENHYKCVVKSPEFTHTVNVFTESNDIKIIKSLALDAVIENSKVCGIDIKRESLVPVSYKKMPAFIC